MEFEQPHARTMSMDDAPHTPKPAFDPNERRLYFVEAVKRLGPDAPPFPPHEKFSMDIVARSHEVSDGCSIRCAAVRADALKLGAGNVSPPAFYNQDVLDALNAGVEYLEAILDAEPHMLNAQNLSGVTLMMKACRLVSPFSKDQRGVIRLMVDRGADVMLCCDSGRNALHDLFWGTSLFEAGHDRETEPEDVIRMLQETFGRRKVLALMMAPDHHGNTPLDFTCKKRWKRIVDVVVNYDALPLPLPVTCGEVGEDDAHDKDDSSTPVDPSVYNIGFDSNSGFNGDPKTVANVLACPLPLPLTPGIDDDMPRSPMTKKTRMLPIRKP